jgi:hypothetical protein
LLKDGESSIRLRLVTKVPKVTNRWKHIGIVDPCEIITVEQAGEVFTRFEANGVLDRIKMDLRKVGADFDELKSFTQTPVSGVNFRFRPDRLDLNGSWRDLRDPIEYGPMRYGVLQHDRLPAKSISDEDTAFSLSRVYRRPIGPSEYDPVHKRMQATMVKQLRLKYGRSKVHMERDGIDILIDSDAGPTLIEIKTNRDVILCIREALGQIIEYAYYDEDRTSRAPRKLVIVGAGPATEADNSVTWLKRKLNLSLEYVQYSESDMTNL